MIPVRKARDLFHKIINLSATQRSCKFTLERYKRDVKKYLQSDPILVYVTQGAIAGFQKDVEAVHENYGKALNFDRQDYHTLGNYAVSLWKLGYLDESIKILEEGIEHINDPCLLSQLIYAHVDLGNFNLDEELAQYRKITKKDHKNQKIVKFANSLIDQYQISRDELKELMRSLFQIFREKNLYISSRRYNCRAGETWFQYDLALDVTEEELDETEDQLEELFSKFSEQLTDHFEIEIIDSKTNEHLESMEKDEKKTDLVRLDSNQIERIGRLVGELDDFE